MDLEPNFWNFRFNLASLAENVKWIYLTFGSNENFSWGCSRKSGKDWYLGPRGGNPLLVENQRMNYYIMRLLNSSTAQQLNIVKTNLGALSYLAVHQRCSDGLRVLAKCLVLSNSVWLYWDLVSSQELLWKHLFLEKGGGQSQRQRVSGHQAGPHRSVEDQVRGFATPALLCHKGAYNRSFPCMEAAPNRTFQCMEATDPYVTKNQRRN